MYLSPLIRHVPYTLVMLTTSMCPLDTGHCVGGGQTTVVRMIIPITIRTPVTCKHARSQVQRPATLLATPAGSVCLGVSSQLLVPPPPATRRRGVGARVRTDEGLVDVLPRGAPEDDDGRPGEEDAEEERAHGPLFGVRREKRWGGEMCPGSRRLPLPIPRSAWSAHSSRTNREQSHTVHGRPRHGVLQ